MEALNNRLWTSPGYHPSQVWWEAGDPHGADRKKPQPCGISSHPEITSFDRQLIGVIAGFLKNNYSPRNSLCTFYRHNSKGWAHVCFQDILRRAQLPPLRLRRQVLFALLHPHRALSRDLSHNGETFVSSSLTALLSLCHRGTPDQAGHWQGFTGGTNQLVIPSPLGFPFSVLPQRMKRTGVGTHIWTFPHTGNYLFFSLKFFKHVFPSGEIHTLLCSPEVQKKRR